MKSHFGNETKFALKNFNISDFKLQKVFYKSIIEIKRAAAIARAKLDSSYTTKKSLIIKTCDELLNNYNHTLFSIDVFQTGSGTSSNMNVNEVIANLASNQKNKIHANDDVNWGQSSNDVIPSAINLSNLLKIQELKSALVNLSNSFKTIINKNKKTYKLGRTHLQDAVPMTVAMEFSGYDALIKKYIKKIKRIEKSLSLLPIGGTAVGTGISSSKMFSKNIILELSNRLKFTISNNVNKFASISFREEQVELMNLLSLMSSSFIKIANDLRLLSSGPNAGFNEITFKKLQAGSSVMPGKVNPVIMESMIQVCALVIGRTTTANIANQNGPLQLNMMMPLLAYISIDSLKIMTKSINNFNKLGIKKIIFNKDQMKKNVWQSSAIVTILKNNKKVGYDLATKWVIEASKRKMSIIDLIKEKNIFSNQEFKKIFSIDKMVKNEK